MQVPGPWATVAFGLFIAGAGITSAAGPLDPAALRESSEQVARQVDQLIDAALPSDARGVPLATDEDFLRRATLDLAGTIPSPNEVTAFGIDPSADKRSGLI